MAECYKKTTFIAMKTIEIDTSQKVTIQYELASLGNRAIAYFVDILIMLGSVIVLLILFRAAMESDYDLGRYFFYLVILPVFFFYTLVSEIVLDGQTLGKRAIGLKIIKLNGDEPSNSDYIIRWMFRMVDIYLSFWSIAALLISSSSNSQRLGGMLSGTAVIRKNSTRQFHLKDILKIQTLDNYEPVYPEITRLSEKDMLFVKQVLERSRRYRNKAHQRAVRELSQHLQSTLQIQAQSNDLQFLRTLINDYIVLTR